MTAYEDLPGLCDRSDEGMPCRDPETDEPCAQCAASNAAHDAYWRRQWDAASPAERDPEAYARDMRDAERGHLLRDNEKL